MRGSRAFLCPVPDVIRLIRANELGEHFAYGLHTYVREKYRELWRIAQMPPAMES